ncbi:DEKNAAC101614 [Brettanomyces naardenensis]|uniref:Mitochondrial 15S rRNA processing factor CCM1 n=1 Tax=Brettanomyces naardenensis TaxID=13370 RepID=A0A448YIE9_BRENA|nr:DEKNAAC101614 [Brettanomyces naardenensis]
MNPRTKGKRLKVKLFDFIDSLDNGQLSKDQLPFINKVVNFIDQGKKSTDIFTIEEMLTILRSSLPAMTLQDVRYIDFFPRFYTALRDTKRYSKDNLMRMELFEIFLNYILLSKNRKNLIAIIDAFIDEEKTLRNADVREQVVDIVLEAFKSVDPDTSTMVRLAELSDLSKYPTKVEKILELFFVAADSTISESYEENDVNVELLRLLDILETKLPSPLPEYINLLYFATRNDFDDCCLTIMKKLSTLTMAFTDKSLIDTIRNDELMAIVSSALKFNDYDQAATKLIHNLTKYHQPKEFTKGEWIAYLQYEMYGLPGDDTGKAIQLVDSLNHDLAERHEKDYQLDDTDTYNYILEALSYSNKPAAFIDSFSQEYDNLYGLVRDSRSFSILIEHYLKLGNLKRALDLFERSLQEAVAWDDDYGGINMPTLFRLLADYFNNSNDDLYYKTQVYKKIKAFEYPIDKKALYSMVNQFLKGNFVGDAMEIFEREVPSLKDPRVKGPSSGKDRYSISDYSDLFQLYYNYTITNYENLKSNWLLYEFLCKFFTISYQYYLGFLKFWIDVGYPSKSLKVYADMKQLSKENKLPPPNEDIYIYLLQSFSRFQYEEGIFTIQLAMKMDLSLNMDIRMLNALMGAFCSLEDSFRVRDVFNNAQALPQSRGLNQESCYWALKSLKFASLNEVNNFYTSLSQFDVSPDANIFGEYLIGHCYYEQYGTALEKLIDTYENGDSHLIDRSVLKNFHNFCLDSRVRKKLDSFATERFPEIWGDLKRCGELNEGMEQPSLLEAAYQNQPGKAKLSE